MALPEANTDWVKDGALPLPLGLNWTAWPSAALLTAS